MPRLIDYVGRFEFIRQAAFAVVRDDGVHALSRRRVAAELGTGVNTIRRSVADWADLARLAADHVVARRRLGRHGRYDETPREVAARLVRSLMPDGPSHLDEELVWLRLVTSCALRPSGLEPPGQLRREFGIAQRGYDDGIPAPEAAPEAGAEDRPARAESRGEALHQYLEEREQEVSSRVDRVLDLLEIAEPRSDIKAVLIALIEGLTLSACRGRLTPERATALAVAHTLAFARDEAGEPDAAA